MTTSKGRQSRQQKLTTDLGGPLLALVERMRRTMQDDLPDGRRVSLGDVVRLALRRLFLNIVVAKAELGKGEESDGTDWLEVAAQIQADGVCPGYLAPGQPGTQVAKQAKGKKGGKR